MPNYYDMGKPLAPEEDNENIYYYIAAACRASQELWSLITEYRAFEKAQANATPKELLLFKIALETVREPLREVTDLKATGEEIAQNMKEFENFKKMLLDTVRRAKYWKCTSKQRACVPQPQNVFESWTIKNDLRGNP